MAVTRAPSEGRQACWAALWGVRSAGEKGVGFCALMQLLGSGLHLTVWVGQGSEGAGQGSEGVGEGSEGEGSEGAGQGARWAGAPTVL